MRLLLDRVVSWRRILGGLFVLPVLLELSLRLFLPPAFVYYRSLKDLHESHPDYLVALSSNADVTIRDNKGLWEGRFRTNSLGMRGSRELSPSEPKLACLGDSMVMGFGVSDEEAFCTLLDRAEIHGRRYQSLNLSVDAFGSRGYAKRLDEVSRLIRLDIVLLFISPNDYTMPDDLRARGIRSDDETDSERFSNPAYLRMFRYRFFLTKHSYLLHALLVSAQQLAIRTQLLSRNLRRTLVHIGLVPYDASRDGSLNHKPGLWPYIRYAFYRPPPKANCKASAPPAQGTPESAHLWCPEPIPAFVRCVEKEPDWEDLPALMPETRRYYDEMIRLSHERGFRLIPILLPIQDEALYCTQAAQYAPVYDYALRALRYFRSRGLDALDLRSAVPEICDMKKEDGSPVRIRDIYIEGDGHYTRYGNEWAARAILRELRKLRTKK